MELRTSGSEVTCLSFGLVVVENDISNRTFVLIANKRRVKVLEILRDFRGDSMIPENVGNIKQVQALINELNFDLLCSKIKKNANRA